MPRKRVCIIPDFEGLSAGGPKSFVRKLSQGFAARNIEVTHDPWDTPFGAVLVVSSSKEIQALLKLKGRTRIVHRLDGLYWRHWAQRMHVKHMLRTIMLNWRMIYTRRFLADHIIYQSRFIKDWWERDYKISPKPNDIIYNGVDLAQFSPQGGSYQSNARFCLISVEGTRQFHQVSLDFPVKVASGLKDRGMDVELKMFGHLRDKFRKSVSNLGFVNINLVENEKLPFYYRGAHLYISAEINPPSPNSVSEALACGVPVVGYSTGALPELVGDTAGRCVPYGADYWNLELPQNSAGLVDAASEVLRNYEEYSKCARERAIRMFDLEKMTDRYVEILFA